MTPALSASETFIMVLALAAGIMATRFVPFLLFRRADRLPRAVAYLGTVLPHAAMALLLVYCLKDVSVVAQPHGLPELIAMAFTGAMQWRWRNVLASIAGGTVLYMALVQMVF